MPFAGLFFRLAPAPAAEKRLFDYNRDKTDQEQDKDYAERDAKAGADAEKIFK